MRCLMLVPSVSEEKLLLALENYQNGFLYQKVGFLLEQFNDSFGLSDSFFAICRKHTPKADRYLSKEGSNYIYHPEWRVIGPKNINNIIDKGVFNYEPI